MSTTPRKACPGCGSAIVAVPNAAGKRTGAAIKTAPMAVRIIVLRNTKLF